LINFKTTKIEPKRKEVLDQRGKQDGGDSCIIIEKMDLTNSRGSIRATPKKKISGFVSPSKNRK
ncbi:MAG: hypothetical protein OXC67_03260, partial [Flavobacteriaceae bacterium]|nr:hypothetical protein [Flavobacteriaceae bacterium]